MTAYADNECVPRGDSAVSVWALFTRSEEPIGKAIRFAAGEPWQHAGIGFTLADGEGVYYEAHWNDGFAGPKPLERLLTWGRKAAGNEYVIVPLPRLPQERAQDIRACAQALTGIASYGRAQLFWMLLFERWRIPVPRSPAKMVCSEALARLVQPEYDLRDRAHRTWDVVTPASAWRRLMEYEAGYSHWTGPPRPA